jgi:SprT protein
MQPTGDDNLLIARIEVRVSELLQQATQLHDRCRRLQQPVLRYDLRGQAAGQARWQARRRPELRFNLDIGRRHADDFVHVTVAHEVAHLVTYQCFGRTRPHGPEWRSVMQHFGIADPRRCHDYDIDARQARHQRRWHYECRCRIHQLSTTRHHRVQRGHAKYHCRRCGETLIYAVCEAPPGTESGNG